MRTIRYFASIAMVCVLSGLALGQSVHNMAGTWKLVAVKTTTLDGKVNPYAFGKNPKGFMNLTADGRMMLMMCDDGRKPLSVVDRVSAPEAERAEAFATFVAYAGRYTLTGDLLVFHLEIASIQNWVNGDQKRTLTFDGNRVTLRTLTTVKGGVQQHIETTWEKLD